MKKRQNDSVAVKENKKLKQEVKKKLILWIPPSSVNHNNQILVKNLKSITKYVQIFAPFQPIDSNTTLSNVRGYITNYWDYCWLNEIFVQFLLFFRHLDIFPFEIQEMILLEIIKTCYLNYNGQLRFLGDYWITHTNWNKEQYSLQMKKDQYKTIFKN